MSTPEQRAKWREAKQAEKKIPRRKKKRRANGAGGVQHDAIVYLRHAERAFLKEIREGRTRRLPRSALLALLALNSLQGD